MLLVHHSLQLRANLAALSILCIVSSIKQVITSNYVDRVLQKVKRAVVFQYCINLFQRKRLVCIIQNTIITASIHNLN